MINVFEKRYNFRLEQKLIAEDIVNKALYNNLLITSIFVIIVLILFFLFSSIGMNLYYKNYITLRHYLYFVQSLTIFIAIAGFFYLPYNSIHDEFKSDRLKYNLTLGLSIGIVIFIFTIVVRILLVNSGLTGFGFKFNMHSVIKSITFYPLSSVAQEVTIKGYLQSYLTDIFKDKKNNQLLAILMSSVTFTIPHLVLSFKASTFVFIFSALLGYIYIKTRSLVSVSIIHYLGGMGILWCNNMNV